VEQTANNPSTTITTGGGINSSATTFAVADATHFPSSGNFRILVEGELMIVTGVSGSTFTVTRGAESTTTASHAQGVAVYGILTKGALDAIVTCQQSGTEESSRRVLNFIGATVADDSGNARTNITIAGLPSIANHHTLANTSGSSAQPVDTSLSALIDDAIAGTQGDILYRGASTWSALAPGTAGYVLKTGGASANPSWVDPTTLGTLIGYGAGASRPGSGVVAGQTYIPSDGIMTSIWSGSAWVGHNPFGAPFTIPPISSSGWTQFNSSAATVTDYPGGGIGVVFNYTGLSSTPVWSLYRSLSGIGTNYTLTAAMIILTPNYSTNARFGITINDGTKTILFGYQTSTHTVSVETYTTTAGGSVASVYARDMIQTPSTLWLRVKNDGTHRTYYTSLDGITFSQAYQETFSTFLTETGGGFGYTDNANSMGALPMLNLLHWSGA
jgi:hypothetical protein